MSHAKRSFDLASTGEYNRNRSKSFHTAKVVINELQWTPVSMPDRLDDVEGFYGLEEIEGVDIIRDDQGKVEYQVEFLFVFSVQ